MPELDEVCMCDGMNMEIVVETGNRRVECDRAIPPQLLLNIGDCRLFGSAARQ